MYVYGFVSVLRVTVIREIRPGWSVNEIILYNARYFRQLRGPSNLGSSAEIYSHIYIYSVYI